MAEKDGEKTHPKMSAAEYIERALADPNFGDPRRDKLAMAALKFTDEDGKVVKKTTTRVKGVKEERADAAKEIGNSGRFATRAAPGTHGSA